MCSDNGSTDGPDSSSPGKLEQSETSEHPAETKCDKFQNRGPIRRLATVVRIIDHGKQWKNLFRLKGTLAEDRLHGRRRWSRQPCAETLATSKPVKHIRQIRTKSPAAQSADRAERVA